MNAKRYKELAAKSRVPMGFLLLTAYVFGAQPSWMRVTAGSLIALIGILLRAWAAGHLDKNRDLCVGGPYAHLRNPLYVGTALVAAGFAVAGGVWWIALLFAAVLLLVYLPVVNEEEAHLRALFPSFADYASRVPRFLPRVTRGTESSPAFRASLYMQNQEYNALAGYLIVLALLLWKLTRTI
jgi:protein-S-isoprenylcysteine O-methyltransferase Ste14